MTALKVILQRGLTGALAATLCVQIGNLAFGVVAARLLGPEGRGDLGAFQVLIVALNAFFILGQRDAITHMVATATQKGSGVYPLIALKILVTLIFISGYFLVSGVAGRFGIPERTQILLFIFGAALFGILSTMNLSFVRGLPRIGAWNVLRCFPVMTQVLIIGVLYIIVEPSPETFLVSILTAQLCLWVLSLFYLFQTVGFTECWDRQKFIRALRYGLAAHPGIVFRQLADWGDRLILSFVAASGPFGIYIVASSLARFVQAMPNSIEMFSFPFLAQKAGLTDFVAKRSYLFLTAMLSLVLCIALWPLLDYIIPVLYGPKFRDSVILCQILLIANFFQSLTNQVCTSIRAEDAPGRATFVDLICGVLVLSSIWLGFTIAGMLGVVCSLTASRIIGFGVALASNLKLEKKRRLGKERENG